MRHARAIRSRRACPICLEGGQHWRRMTQASIEAVGAFAEDCIPPECDYESQGALLNAINEWAAPRGYAFTTGRSTYEKTGRRTITYMCDRSCRPPTTLRDRQRKTTTRGTGCPFSVLAKESRDKNTWTLRHRPDKRFSVHNHPPSQHLSAHPAHRKLSNEDEAKLASLANSGVAPKHIRTYLRQYCNSSATQQDVYNCIAATRRKVCEGQSSIHALANQLDQEGFWSRIQFDPDGRVTAVMFAHPDSLAYLQAYPDILLLDCTYKTNKHRMPLLDMIGVDACQKSFCIGFAFLSGETEEDYIWALDRLRSLYEHHSARLPSVVLTDRCTACMNAVAVCFPSSCSLLCLWHANKAVLRRCLPAFSRQDQLAASDLAEADTAKASTTDTNGWGDFYRFWHSIIGSTSEQAFKERVLAFEKKYVPDYLNEVGYVKSCWLEPYKDRLVKAWVDQHTHFGNTATSRVEGIHALLKSHLNKSTLDLFEAWRAMKHALLNQLSQLQTNQALQQTRFPIELSGPLYSAVRGWVSHEALRKVEEQRKLLDRRNPPPPLICTGSFTRSQGLPCLHAIKILQDGGQVLSLEHFHSHWHLRRSGAPRLLLEPRQRIEPSFSASNIPKQSIRREPSSFESVEVAAKAPPKCSRCHAVGHTRMARVCPLRFEELLQQETTASEPLPQSATPSDPDPVLHQMIHLSESLDEVLAPVAEDDPSPTVLAHPLTPSASHSAQSIQSSAVSVESPPASRSRRPSTSPGRGMPNSPSSIPQLSGSPVHETQRLLRRSSPLPPRYDSPQAIYGRYVTARGAWYARQPAGSIKTNQQYRRAMALPVRYDRQSYEWCLDYKQMSKRCITSTGSREWTKEEMMAYLDWSKAEEKRIEAQVAKEMGDNPLASGRRGVKDIWQTIEKDSREREAFYAEKDKTEQCIFVEL